MYVPLGVLAATVTIPLASMLNGPVVNGVTLVLVVVAAMHLTYHLSMRSMPLLPYCLRQQLPMDRLLHRLDCLLQLWL
jgi:ethanolamine transporter EutH